MSGSYAEIIIMMLSRNNKLYKGPMVIMITDGQSTNFATTDGVQIEWRKAQGR